MKRKRVAAIFIIIAMGAAFLSGCGQSNAIAQERRAAERQSDKQSAFNESSIMGKDTEQPSPDEGNNALQEPLVWVKETEIVRDMKSGKVITLQHEGKVNRDGLIEEDLVKDPDGNIKILRYCYDGNGNNTWKM